MLEQITKFFVDLQPWLSIGLLAAIIVSIIFLCVLIVKVSKKKKYIKTLLNSIDILEKKVDALKGQATSLSLRLSDTEMEVATFKSEKHKTEEHLKEVSAELNEKENYVKSLEENVKEYKEKLEASIPLEEYKKLSEELEKNKKKTIKVDTLITKVEELTEKTKPVIKKVIKKEIAKLKKYSLEDLKAMYKHELMTLAQSLKLTGWTRYSKEKLAQFVYDNLPKNQKK